MRSIVVSVIVLIIASCNRMAGQSSQSGLTGKWTFTEYLSDPGDGSGKWQPAPAGQSYIEFRSDSTIRTDVSQFLGYDRYSVVDNNAILLQGNGNSFKLTYSIIGKTLQLNPPCREPCGLKFRK
ncbi:MAG TPA: hypothetical protein VD996_01440 [Chitinophagaceae bacterium]|nr:hypothetical protein [Chitinophagaceae bacterium]